MSNLTFMSCLIFTDLDATLLNHDYTCDEARPALDLIEELQIPLVLNSSKTLAEMHELCQKLNLSTPIIAENGGQVAIPSDQADIANLLGGTQAHPHLPYFLTSQSPTRDDILAHVHSLRVKHGYQFEGFADWSVEQISEHTGLDTTAAKHSADRYVTEPIIWKDSEVAFLEFETYLKEINARAIHGGRFIHLMGQSDKVDGMNTVTQLFQQQFPDRDYQRVVLGDAPNDAAMLNAADIAVVLPYGNEGCRIKSTAPQVIYAELEASAGWNAAILSILKS